jgi:hypothetical protein
VSLTEINPMMEAEILFEKLDINTMLTRLIARKYFIISGAVMYGMWSVQSHDLLVLLS